MLIEEITLAKERIGPHILKTPLIKSSYLSDLIEGEVYLKLENEQHTGSFKARGALNKVLSLTEEERARGLVTASTGNHAQGFARALQISDAEGQIYLPENAQRSKVEALSQYKVELIFYGTDSLATEIYAKSQASKENKVWVSPYNDQQVAAGQGTIGVELTDELSNIDAVFGCVGGGGMLGGIAGWVKYHSPSTHVVGCQPENSPEMSMSIEQGKIVFLDEYIETLSDGSAGGVEEGSITYDMCKQNVDSWVLIPETEIPEGIRFMAEKHHKIIEGSASVAIRGLVNRASEFMGKRVVVIVCGGNIDMKKFKDIL